MAIPPPPTQLTPNDPTWISTSGAQVPVTLSWTASAGATHYALRVEDQTVPSLRDPRNDCQQHFICMNHVTSTSVTFAARAGHAYSWWVHAVNAEGTSAPAGAAFRIGEPPAAPDYQPGLLRVYVTAPHYRELIPPTPPAWRAEIVVARTTADVDVTFTVRGTVVDAKDAVLASAEASLPPDVSQQVLTFTVPPLAPGRYRLNAGLYDAGGTLREQKVHEYDVHASEPVVRLDEKQRIRRHSVPWFPFGFYIAEQMDGPDFQLMASWGATCALSYGFGFLGYKTGNEQPALDFARQFLDRAYSNGMGIIWNLAGFYQDAEHFPNPDARTGLELATVYVRNFRSHPAILSWYLADEPNLGGRVDRFPKLFAMQQLVADSDSDHPSWIVLLSGSKELNDTYSSAADFLAVDPYPIPGYPLTTVEAWTRNNASTARGVRPHWTVPQLHQKGVYEQFPIDYREPNPAEKICMPMLALIAGARGLIFYSYFDQFREVGINPDTGEYERRAATQATRDRRFREIAAMAAHLRSVIPALLSGTDRNLKPAAATEIRRRAIEFGGELWIILANPTTSALTATFTLPSGNWSSAEAPHGEVSARLLTATTIEATVPATSGGVIRVERAGVTGTRWTQLPDRAHDIGVGGNGEVWIIGTRPVAGGFEVRHLVRGAWQTVPGTGGVRIAAGPSGPWVVRSGGAIRRYDGSQWAALPGDATDIGVGPRDEAWIIGTNAVAGGFDIRRWDGGAWRTIEGGAVRIAVGPDGVPWVVNDSHAIFRHNGVRWDRVPGSALDISVGADGTAWMVGTETASGGRRIYRWNGIAWTRVDGGAVAISVGPNGKPWMVNAADAIFRRQ